jgi:peroxiredoxin
MGRRIQMCKPVLGLSAIVAIGLLITGPVGAAPVEVKTLEIGARAPDFNLPGVDGKRHRLAEYDMAKILVIVFTCNHCPTAQAYEERLKKLAADYKDKGVALVAISPNDPQAVRLDELGYTDLSDSLAEMQVRAKDKSFNFPYLYDGDKQAVSRAYGPTATPHVFVFDSERKLRYAGRVDDNERKPAEVKSRDARNAVEALLAGKAVPVEKTQTVGCSIKWSDKRDSVKQAFEKWAKESVTLQSINRRAVRRLAQNATNKVRLITVWSTGPESGGEELAKFVEMNRMYRGREFEMVSISLDGPKEKDKAQASLEKSQASFTNYLFASQSIDAVKAALDPSWSGSMPYTLLVQPGGEVLYRHAGAVDPLEVKKAVVAYLGRTYK